MKETRKGLEQMLRFKMNGFGVLHVRIAIEENNTQAVKKNT